MKTVTQYHVFTNRRDEWFDSLDEAKAQYLEWGDGYGCARLYREVQDEDGETIEEDCLESTGDYPT